VDWSAPGAQTTELFGAPIKVAMAQHEGGMQVVKQRIRAKDMDPEMIEMIKRNMPKNG
jgi:hypothetical protein